MALSEAGGVSVEEVGGKGRRLVLRGRALPYQRVTFEGELRLAQTWYPGNAQATLQVLGPSENNTVMSGAWKDRFLRGAVEAQGFDSLDPPDDVTAAGLVAAFEALRREGVRVRVRWADVSREGVVARVSATWIRPQDVEWEVEFAWVSLDDGRAAPRAAAAEPSLDDQIAEAQRKLDDALADEPKRLSEDFKERIKEPAQLHRVESAKAIQTAREARNAIRPADALGQALSLATTAHTVRLLGVQALGLLVDEPYVQMALTDAVTDVLRLERYKRNAGRAQHRSMAVHLRGAERERRRVAPGSLTVITVPGETTLRKLALRYYGTADEWQRIADANGLHSSHVEAGTTLVIPAPPGRPLVA